MQVEGENESRRAALKVLDVALGCDDLGLLKDLVRFLDLNPANVYTSGVSSAEAERTLIFKGDEEYYLQEVLLSRHARKLLRSRSLKAFVEFGDIVGRPLRMWLYREKNRDASIPAGELESLIDTISIEFDVSVISLYALTLSGSPSHSR